VAPQSSPSRFKQYQQLTTGVVVGMFVHKCFLWRVPQVRGISKQGRVSPRFLHFSAFISIVCLLAVSSGAQEFRSHKTIPWHAANISLDLSSLSSVDGASITLRNSSPFVISQPQISLPNNLWTYSSAVIAKQIPKTGTDHEIAVRALQYVADRTGYYCSAGTKAPGVGYISDPIRILNGHGYGCCEQLAATLAWIWKQLGYQARLAAFNFHTVPEISYAGAWHMYDPTHRVFYLKSDGTVASVEDILADTSPILSAADANGNDPIGWPAAEMAALYQQNAGTLSYQAAAYSDGYGIRVNLRPHEQLRIEDRNRTDQLQVFPDQFVPLDAVNSGQFAWDLSYGLPDWKSLTASINNVDVVSDPSGVLYLQNTTSSAGSVVYSESSMFPVLGLSIAAQVGPNAGTMQAYVSLDGINWSSPVSFVPANDISSYQLYADLSSVASGFYKYFIKVELSGGMQLHKLRITPCVQVSKFLFPALTPGTTNTIFYNDSSNIPQGRIMDVTTEIPTGKPLIRGLVAKSLVPESVTYSLSRDLSAANLVDRDPESMAYPAAPHLDYQISMRGPYHVTGISIDWGKFGTDSRYISSFSILAKNGTRPWQVIATGGFPAQETSSPVFDGTATDVRIIADSSSGNWIGIYDVRLFGTALPQQQIVPATVQSNVPENFTYSISRGYGATNLIDGSWRTFAYPASQKLDYQLGFAATTHLTWSRITWGRFGSSPGYIDNWSMLGRTAPDQPWITLAQGGFPGADATVVPIIGSFTDIRVTASSQTNWIGMAEVEFGDAPPVPTLSAFANVPEVNGPDAMNLVDDNSATVAYPGRNTVDFTIDEGQENYIDSVQSVWGFWGTDPTYISSWQLLGLPDHGNGWEVIARGGFPNGVSTIIPVQNRYRKLRIQASSPSNWIGLADVVPFGSQ
jgi:hypothetical protein